ncbi:MAG: hypothetical protein H5U34_20180, partial [Klebsiella pneumoniae]|nr:hypothetical protein [Klebsiella pneumoniae]
MSYRMFDYLVPNVNFFGPNAISVVGERCQTALCISTCGHARHSQTPP